NRKRRGVVSEQSAQRDRPRGKRVDRRQVTVRDGGIHTRTPSLVLQHIDRNALTHQQCKPGNANLAMQTYCSAHVAHLLNTARSPADMRVGSAWAGGTPDGREP